MDNSIPLESPLKQLTKDSNLDMLEAAIPYVNNSAKQPLALYIKINELSKMFRGFQDEEMLSACGFEAQNRNYEAMLQAMRLAAGKEQASQIDKILNVINTTKLYKTYAEAMKTMTPPETKSQETTSSAQANDSKNNSQANPDLLTRLLPLLMSNQGQDNNQTDIINTISELLKNQ